MNRDATYVWKKDDFLPPDLSALDLCELMEEVAHGEQMICVRDDESEPFAFNDAARHILFAGLISLSQELGFYEDVVFYFMPCDDKTGH